MTSGAHSPAHDIRKLVVGLIDDQHLTPAMAQRYRPTVGAPRADVFVRESRTAAASGARATKWRRFRNGKCAAARKVAGCIK
jgi:hypothetical protein